MPSKKSVFKNLPIAADFAGREILLVMKNSIDKLLKMPTNYK